MLYESKWATTTAEQTAPLDTLCGGCNGACCRDMILPLRKKEARWLISNGTDLQEMPELKEGAPRGQKIYRMAGACGLLDPATNLCSAYDERPEACRVEIEPGDEVCMGVRAERLPSGPVPLPMPTLRVSPSVEPVAV